MNLKEAKRGANTLLFNCGNAVAEDRILIVHDKESEPAAQIVVDRAKESNLNIDAMEIPLAPMHGTEPPPDVARRMTESTLILGMTQKSMAHTKARQDAAAKGARYLSLPEYSVELLTDASLTTDFQKQAKVVRAIADIFTQSDKVHVTSKKGTDVYLKINNRTGNYCPGFVTGPGELGSPPDIEANVSPLETESEGVVVIDGSIPFPGFGLLNGDLRLTIEKGLIRKIDFSEPELVTRLEKLFMLFNPQKTKVLAELGIGLNPNAKLRGIMLTDEGAYGTAHFGFGANSTVGGINSVPFHLDFVFNNPTIQVDQKIIIADGVVL